MEKNTPCLSVYQFKQRYTSVGCPALEGHLGGSRWCASRRVSRTVTEPLTAAWCLASVVVGARTAEHDRPVTLPAAPRRATHASVPRVQGRQGAVSVSLGGREQRGVGHKGCSDPVIRTDPRGKECLSIEQSPGEGGQERGEWDESTKFGLITTSFLIPFYSSNLVSPVTPMLYLHD